MNWGALSLAQAKLRILELEDELLARGTRRPAPAPAAHVAEIPVFVGQASTPRVSVYQRAGPPRRSGIGQLIRSAMPHEPPGMRPAEIAARLEDIHASTVSAYMSQWTDVRKTGEPRHHRYYLDPEPAA